jgi:amino acid transporter
MTSIPTAALASSTLGVLADGATGVHYSPMFYGLLGVVAVAVLIVFFTVVRFVLKLIDRRSRG